MDKNLREDGRNFKTLTLTLLGDNGARIRAVFKWIFIAIAIGIWMFLASGCSSTPERIPVVVKPLPCGQALSKDMLEACSLEGSGRIADGAPFIKALDQNAQLKKAFRDCNAKVEVLQKTIKTCQQLAG